MRGGVRTGHFPMTECGWRRALHFCMGAIEIGSGVRPSGFTKPVRQLSIAR
jgi:hypothetical protein